jgi:hypothetical protein
MVRESSMRDRPGAVSSVAVFLFTATAIASVVATSLLFPGTLLDRLWELNKPAYAGIEVLGRASGVLLLLLGMATAAVVMKVYSSGFFSAAVLHRSPYGNTSEVSFDRVEKQIGFDCRDHE